MTERLFASRPVKLHDGRWFVRDVPFAVDARV